MTLSNKRILVDEHFAHYPEEDVKEFIEKVKKVFHKGTLYEGESIWEIIDAKAGDKLI